MPQGRSLNCEGPEMPEEKRRAMYSSRDGAACRWRVKAHDERARLSWLPRVWMTRLSEVDVGADARNQHGAAIFVVARIIDVLQVERHEETAPQMCGVEGFNNFFGAVGEAGVAEEEAEAAEREILLMGFDNSIGDERHAGAVVVAAPPATLRETANLDGAIVLGVGEGFVAAVAPSEAPEHVHLWNDFLLEI